MLHRAIEELSLNAWPALQTYVYDGWLLRFADGYTKRSNSVSPLYTAENENLEEKVIRCEEMYSRAGLPTVFKMTQFADGVSELDGLLERKGYRIVDPTRVKVLEDLSAVQEPDYQDVAIQEELSEDWLTNVAGLLGLTEHQRQVSRLLLGQSRLKQGFFTLYVSGRAAACGIGVIENGYVGLYDIVTHPEFRGQGFAEQLIRHLLKWARAAGADKSYLLVVQSNAPANRLYDKFGYREVYSYWYRVKDRA